MRFRIVECPCGNQEPHKRFRSEDGRESKSFFTIARGEAILKSIEASGATSPEEAAETRAELAACGLPAETENSESVLLLIAATMIATVPAAKREEIISRKLSEGTTSEKSAARIRELLADEKATLRAADVEDLRQFASCVPAEERDALISEQVIEGIIDGEQAEQLRTLLKDAPLNGDPMDGMNAFMRFSDRKQSLARMSRVVSPRAMSL